jgi:hypothetical protein
MYVKFIIGISENVKQELYLNAAFRLRLKILNQYYMYTLKHDTNIPKLSSLDETVHFIK